MDVRAAGREWSRRLGRPLFAAVLFCAAGLTSAVLAVGVNRILASRSLPPATAVLPGSSASPSATPPPATPSSSPASCADAAQARGDLKGLSMVAPAPLTVTDGDTTLQVIIPAGATLDGRLQDLHAHLQGASPAESLSGTLVQDVQLCAQSGSATVAVTLSSGAQVDGSVVSTAAGVEAQDVHVRQSSDSGND